MSYISIKLKIVTATVLFLYSRGKNGNKMLCNIVQFCAREYFFFFLLLLTSQMFVEISLMQVVSIFLFVLYRVYCL